MPANRFSEDEGPDLHKQFGCISGLFQVFDRYHLMSKRQLASNTRKGLSPGKVSSASNCRSTKIVSVKNSCNYEYLRSSEESSRASFSSSSCSSSFSSLESSKLTQHESPIFDFKDIVKESIYRENQGLSVKTDGPKEAKRIVVKNKDSPRPPPLPEAVDRIYAPNGKSSSPMDLDESFGVIAKLKQGQRSSKTPLESRSREATARHSLDSMETRISARFIETTRFSLDSRQSSLKEVQRRDLNPQIVAALASRQDWGDDARSPSIIAKLMGLDVMPECGNNLDDVEDGRKRSHLLPNFTRNGQEKACLPPNKRETVYGEIARKLNELEFQQSNKDLRALKQILDAIKAKGLLEAKKIREEPLEASRQNSNLNLMGCAAISLLSSSNLPKINVSDSPIVIMKPAKFTNKCSSPPSISKTYKSLLELQQVRKNVVKDRSPRHLLKDGEDKKHGSPRHERSCIENKSRSPSPSRPLTQQKRLALERKSRLEASNQQRQAKQSSASSTSPRAKFEAKHKIKHKYNGHLITNSRNSSPQYVELPHRSNSTNKTDHSPKSIRSSLMLRDAKHMNGSRQFGEESITIERDACANEQPSPVSVLNRFFYGDASPASLTDGSSISCIDEEEGNISWRSLGASKQLPSTPNSDDIDLERLGNVACLVHKLEQLSKKDNDELQVDDASLRYEDKCPDERYISEVLVVSGLLFEDPNTILSLNNASFPINPKLYHILERKIEILSDSKSKIEKLHRRLVFDTINEILSEKMEPGMTGKLRSSGRHLVEELRAEIGCLDSIASSQISCFSNEDDDEDGLKSILAHDITRHNEGWMGNGREVSGMILDIERSIFKDLIDEILCGETVRPLQLVRSSRGM